MLLIPRKKYPLTLIINSSALELLSFIGKAFFALARLNQSLLMSSVDLPQFLEGDTSNSKCFSSAFLHNHHILWSSMGKQFRFLLAICCGATIAPLIRMPMLSAVLGRMTNLVHLAISMLKQASLGRFICV